MEHQAQNSARSIDVTGLPEEAIRAVETHVAALREQACPNTQHRSHEEWSKALHEWANSHPTRTKFADWSRESIYADDGE